MKSAGILFAILAVLVFSGAAAALCICQGGPQSVSCKACGSASNAAPVSYAVKPGQLLADIAKECGVDAATIAQANALPDGAVLQGGQVLQVPGGKCGSASPSAGSCDKANAIVSKANAHKGQLPGAFGCPSPGCACFASTVYKEAGMGFGYSAWAPAVFDMSRAKGTVIDKYSDLQPGDLVFYTNTYCCFAAGTITHVEIYVGGGKTIGSGDVPVAVHGATYFGNHFYEGVRVAKC